MKIVQRSRRADSSAAQRMLPATPSVGKAILAAGFAMAFGVVILVVVVGWLLDGVQFGLTQWLFVLAMVALLGGGILLGRRIPRAIRLERSGRRAEGHIVGGWRENDDDSVRYFLAFAVDDLTFKQQVNRHQYAAYQSGDQVSVIQLSDQPEIARMILP